jgi:hypothetical protein
MKKCSHPIVEERNKKTTKLRRKKYRQKKLEKLQGVPKMTKILMITNVISQNNQKLHNKVLTSKFQQKQILKR